MLALSVLILCYSYALLDSDKHRTIQLGADLYQTKTCDSDSFDRFAHWVSRMCAVDRQRQARLAAGEAAH